MEAHHVTIQETVSATAKLGRDDALGLIARARHVIVAKGKKVQDFDPTEDDTDAIADLMLGRTGNLRAPTLVIGDTLIVGFNEERYLDLFGA